VLGSLGLSLYVNNFGSDNKTYGALAGIVVFLLWLFLTSYIVQLGAKSTRSRRSRPRRTPQPGNRDPSVSAEPKRPIRSRTPRSHGNRDHSPRPFRGWMTGWSVRRPG
jgi:uncharacterized BrkB/YihY/UPF0761 family membrane protein